MSNPNFPFVVEEKGVVKIRRYDSPDSRFIDVDRGDVFTISPSPEHALHHNHGVLCKFDARKDVFRFFPHTYVTDNG